MGDAACVVGGAVDRVDDPQTLATAPAFLLADECVPGIATRDRCADEALDLAVHRGDDIVSPLERRYGLPERRVRELARVACERRSEFESIHHSNQADRRVAGRTTFGPGDRSGRTAILMSAITRLSCHEPPPDSHDPRIE